MVYFLFLLRINMTFSWYLSLVFWFFHTIKNEIREALFLRSSLIEICQSILLLFSKCGNVSIGSLSTGWILVKLRIGFNGSNVCNCSSLVCGSLTWSKRLKREFWEWKGLPKTYSRIFESLDSSHRHYEANLGKEVNSIF